MFKIPILLLTFKRPVETKKILNQILSIKPKRVYIFQDGENKNFKKEDKDLYNKTKNLIENYQKHKCIKYIKSEKNIGQRFLAEKVLKIIFKKEKQIIFLEDDTLPKQSFFNFCSTMLERYEKNNKIFHISGCNLYNGTIQKKVSNKSFFFSKYPQFWGWATWRHKWNKLYEAEILDWNENKKKFLDLFQNNTNEKRFFEFYVENNFKGKHIGWDIPWIYKLILNNKLTVLPNVNTVKNIGFNSNPSGKGAQKFRNLKSSNLKFPLKIENIISSNCTYDNYLRKSFYHRKNVLNRILDKFTKIFRNCIN